MSRVGAPSGVPRIGVEVRILYVCSDFGVPVYGHKGASIHLRAMAGAFAACGHDIQVLSPACERNANHEFTVALAPALDTAAWTAAADALRKVDRRLGTLPGGHAARVGQEVRNLLYNQTLATASAAGRGFDCIYERYALFGFGGLELARALGIPHVLEVNAPLCAEQSRVRGLHLSDVAQSIEDRVWGQTDALLAVSEEIATQACQRGAAAERVHVIANGVDVERFALDRRVAGERVRAAYGLGDGAVIGFVGSLKPWHGTDVLVAAFARIAAAHPHAKLLLVGDGPASAGLRAQIAELGLEARVVFTGAVEHARVPELIAAMDVAVAPYRASDDFYFSPIKVYEYLAAGTPVVASPLGQITALVAEGYVTPARAGDADDLAAALTAQLAAPHPAAAAAARGREWTLRERTWTANARRVAAILDGLMAAAGARTRA
jgi:glycosyltransferase involved in cell wall biosynthesis